MTATYRIIYPSGDRTKLKVELVLDRFANDYAYASTETFLSPEEAEERMIDLARKFCKLYVSQFESPFLDLN